MAEKKKPQTATQKWAAKNKKKTTSKDMVGSGTAKGAAKAIEKRKKEMAKY